MVAQTPVIYHFCVLTPHIIHNARLSPFSRLSSRELYNIRLCKIAETPPSQLYIHNMLNAPSLPWKSIYLLIWSISIDSYSRVFQYKCLNNILYLNRVLCRMGLSDTSLCSFCHGDDETMPHLFYSYYVSKSVWSDLQSIFSHNISLLSLSLLNVVLFFVFFCLTTLIACFSTTFFLCIKSLFTQKPREGFCKL